MTSTIETNVTEEDQSLIDDFWDNLKDMTITGGEVTLNKIGDCVSKMPIDDLQNLGKLIKKYSYYGALLALKESLDTKDMGPIGRYALAAGISVLVIPASYGILSTTLLAIAIGAFVDVTWAYIEEHKDDIENKLKDLLASVEIEMDENTISVNYCPLPKYNAIYVKDDTCMSSNLTRTTAQSHQSPLALDLDGDGVETTTVESGVYFDHDDNGFAEKSGWVGKDDGLLVRDINNNGKIDNGTELFGNNSVLSSGAKAANGFEALADLDSNNDGVFNSSDTAWNQVKVWKDANQNGEVDSGELLTLAQAGVSGINLEYDNATTTDENGNEHKQTGTFIKTDGTTGSVHDVWFDGDYANTMDTTDVEISDTIAALPNIQDSDGNTALFWANGEKESIEMLIKAGAKTDIRNKNGSLYYQVDSIPILGLSTNL